MKKKTLIKGKVIAVMAYTCPDKLKKYSLFILCGLFFMTCATKKSDFNGQLIDEFPEPIMLEGTRVLPDQMGLAYMERIDSLLILSKLQDPLIKIYNNENFNHIADFGRTGRGPNEFATPPMVRDYVKEGDGTSIFAYNQSLHKWLKIDLEASMEANEIILNKAYDFPVELRGAGQIFYVSDTMMMGVYDDHFYKQLDGLRGGFYYYPEAGKVQTFPLFNLDIEPEEPNNVMPATNINARMSAISPDRSRFVTVMVNYPGLEIFDVGSNSSTRYMLDPDPPPVTLDLKTYEQGEFIQYYNYIKATNDYIYLSKTGILDRNWDSAYETRIQVIDWEGNPQAQYVIPSKYSLAMFTVDEKNERFYGISHSNDAAYQFDINH